MNIKSRLYISAGISIVLVVALVSVVLVTSGRIAEENKKHQLLMDVYVSVSELDTVTYDYLLHHEERMERQWNIKHHSLGEILDGLAEKEGMLPIRADYAALGNLFSQITVNYEERQKYIQEGAAQEKIDTITELEERLVAQLLIKSHSIIADASRLAEEAHTEATEAQRVASNLTVILMIVLAIIVATVSLLTVRSISKPLNELTKGAEIIGKGDLDHKVEIKTKDELGELAAAFNQMTERRQLAHETLRQSEAKYQDLFDSAPVAYFCVGIDGLIKGANKAAENLSGYRSEELQKMKVFNLYAEESKEKAKGLFEKFKRGISWENEEMIYERKDGQKIHGLLSVRPIKDENGLVLESHSVVVDITERKRAEDELEQHRNRLEEMVGIRTAELDKRISEAEQLNSAMVNLMEDLRVSKEILATRSQQLTEANKELDAFAYSVSHDLRAPLRAVAGFSQMLVEDYGDKLDEQGQHQLDVIQGSARQMGQLIDDLLAFSRLGRKELRMLDINMRALAEEVIKQFQIIEPERTARLKVDALPPTVGDRSMIREVFANLLSNALKYTAPREAAVIEVNAKTERDENIYSVRDNGVGFDMKYTGKLFKVFQRLHSTEEFEGTGIGLALVKRIVHRHGGRVWAEGQVNQGATFYFALPIRKEKEDD